MKVISLYSGSQGNSTLVDTGTTRLLIDAGGSYKALTDALCRAGYHISEISDIFITHEHSDHTHALPVLLKKHQIRIHMTSPTAEALGIEKGSPLDICTVRYGNEFEVTLSDGTRISSFLAPHDSVCCVGYRIDNGEDSVGVVTDIGYVTQRVYDCLCGCKAVVIEANHDKEMVRCGSYPAALKRRILSGGGHLSNDDCAEISAALARKGTKNILLAHLSLENNTENVALETVNKAVSDYGVKVK